MWHDISKKYIYSYLKCTVYDKLLKPPTIILNNPVYSILNDIFCGISPCMVCHHYIFQDQIWKYLCLTSLSTRPTPGTLIFNVYSFFFTTMLDTLASYILWKSEFSHLVEELTQRSTKPSIYAETNNITRKVMKAVITITSLEDTTES